MLVIINVCYFTSMCCEDVSFVINYCIATRVCHCNGEWGPVHCHPSLQLVEELVCYHYRSSKHAYCSCIMYSLNHLYLKIVS